MSVAGEQMEFRGHLRTPRPLGGTAVPDLSGSVSASLGDDLGPSASAQMGNFDFSHAGGFPLGELFGSRRETVFRHQSEIGIPTAEAVEHTPGLSIVVPAWNEEARLPKTLDRYLPFLEARKQPFEVIIVVDGSNDATASVARSYAARGVRVLEFPHKLGKGGAVLQGLRAAKFDVVGYVDADGPIVPAEIDRLVGSLDYADVAVGSRWAPESVVTESQPPFRILAGRAFNLLSRVLLGLKLKDTQCGAKFMRRAMVQSVLHQVTLSNWAFDVDLLYHMRKAGATITEVGVTWRHDSASKLPVMKIIPVMFLSVIGVRLMNLPISHRVPRKMVDWFVANYGTA
ncbi:MAG: glycosyltransferase family 2 protein [Thermoplasmata archaeon]|nr:glycosyltransferase family 2 protein [Thermoplasmata archaeon]